MKKLMLVPFLAFLSVVTFSQENIAGNDTIRKNALNVYISSASDYIKKEITFINYVRDLKAADLYIISTYQSTGSGGSAYTYFLVGQNKFAGMTDTVVVNTLPDDTEEIIRIKQVKALKMALMRYIMKTPLAQYIDIHFTMPVKESIANDKWKNWVFSTNFYTYLDLESSIKETYINGSMTANHVIEKNKFEFAYSYGWDNIDFNYSGTKINSYSRRQYLNILFVKSINPHWSGGLFVTGLSSVYNNYDLQFSANPAIEYDIYPYDQANRRQLRLLYQIGYQLNNYHDSTIYFKTSEILPHHSFTAAYKVIEKWGSVSLSMIWSNYLHNWHYNNLSLYGSSSLRIAKGLSFSIGGQVSIVHDQLSLIKGGASYNEVLLRQKEIATSYMSYMYLQLTYTFGSIYNNVVNPRFGQ